MKKVVKIICLTQLMALVFMLSCKKEEVSNFNNQYIDVYQRDCIQGPIDSLAGISCTEEFFPVCGCNEVTYSNACKAEANGISNYIIGQCGECIQGPIQTGVSCTQEYDPVCGCNGVTYGNACNAWVNGITQYTLGKCP